MSQRLCIYVSLILALLLVPATSHARWLNPASGRFQTMDTYEGDQRDPASLHKYAYAADDPVNNMDPSGQMTLTETINTVAILFALTTIAGVGITYAGAQSAALDADGWPDAAIVSISESVATRGVGADFGFDVLYHFNSQRLYAFPEVSVGLTPLSYFRQFRDMHGPSITFGGVWNLNSIDEWAGTSLTATWPYSIVHLIPSALGNRYKSFAAIRQLAKRDHNIRNSDWVFQVSLSTSGPAAFKVGPRSNVFAAQAGVSTQPIDLTATGESIVDMFGSEVATKLNLLPTLQYNLEAGLDLVQ